MQRAAAVYLFLVGVLCRVCAVQILDSTLFTPTMNGHFKFKGWIGRRNINEEIWQKIDQKIKPRLLHLLLFERNTSIALDQARSLEMLFFCDIYFAHMTCSPHWGAFSHEYAFQTLLLMALNQG